MKYRKFGKTGWNISEMGYGIWGMGGWTGSDDGQSLQSLQKAILNWIDEQTKTINL